jgi:ATP/ADP translocase
MHWVLAHIEVWVLMLFYVCWSLGSQCVCLFSQENEVITIDEVGKCLGLVSMLMLRRLVCIVS